MKTYFFDTSGIVKRYVTELGSKWVTELCEEAPKDSIILSYATLAEAAAAFCRRARAQNPGQRLSGTERDLNIKLFRQDAEWQYFLVHVTKPICARAGDLCRSHNLRAYDAVQLATALAVSDRLTANGGAAPVFVSADTFLLSVAQAEGLDIENPNTH